MVDETAALPRSAAELQDELQRRGEPLGARDADIAGTAHELDERLAVADLDFDVPGFADLVDVAFL